MKNLPQPHEGITGSDRDQDDLLALDDKAIARRMLIIGLAGCLDKATLVGNPAPVVERMNKRIRDPQPGDLVIEQSTLGRRRIMPDGLDQQIKAFGILIEHRDEWWQTDADYEATLVEEREVDPGYDRSRSVDHAWYIQYGSEAGDICRWTNCSFAAIPTDGNMFDIPVGTRDGNGVTFTRDDILGGLADSGFRLRTP